MIPTLPTIEKEDPRIPDKYGIQIIYHDKTEETIEAVDHVILQTVFNHGPNGQVTIVGPLAIPTLQILTAEDLWRLIPFTVIKNVDFDRRWTELKKLQAEKNKDPQKERTQE